MAPEVIVKANYWIQIDVWSLAVVVFALYSGALPFASYDKKEMDRMVVQDPLKFDKPGFEKKDAHRKDLLSKMLVKDPKDRIRIEDVIEHPYFQEVVELKRKKPAASPNHKKARHFTSLMAKPKKIA